MHVDVTTMLPINVTNAELEDRPGFSKLLHALSGQITSEGTSVSLQKDLVQAESTLKHEKLKWLQYHILYTELHDLLIDQQLKLTQANPSSNKDFYSAVGESLTYAEIGDYVSCHPDPGSNVTLLGLNKDEVYKANPHYKHVPALQQKLIPEIESRLRKKCENLVNFHESSSNTPKDSSKQKFNKAAQLPSLLEHEKRQLEEEQKFLKKEKQERERQFWQYYQALLDSLNILESLITKHQLHTQSHSDTTTTQWLTARCDAMYLKIKTFEKQLLCDTYNAETVKALTKIRNHIDVATLETQHDLSTTGHALKAYEAVGSGFDDLVKDYTQIRDELDNKKWAIRELKSPEKD